MADYKIDTYQKQAHTIIKNLAKRQMQGYYFNTSAECIQAIQTMIPSKSVVSFGGSETLKEAGLFEMLARSDYEIIDRTLAKTPEEARETYAKTVMADYYFMSTNAITLDGELINIDGNGNRLACMMQGPRNVFMIVGMNKIVSNITSGVNRVKDIAAPMNTTRLNRNTPCHKSGRCEDCFSTECVCSHTVITRRCSQKDRIHIFLVGESLGY